MSEVDYAVAEFTRVTPAQRRAVRRNLTAWARVRSLRPDDDPQMVELLRGIERLAATLVVRLDETSGLLVSTKEDRTATLLSRGTLWFRGGDWQSVALAAVSSETSITT